MKITIKKITLALLSVAGLGIILFFGRRIDGSAILRSLQGKEEPKNQILHTHIPAQTKEKYLDYVYTHLEANFTPSPTEQPEIPMLEGYDKIVVTFLQDNKIRCCQSGQSGNYNLPDISHDLQTAVRRCLDDERFGGPIQENEISNLEAVITILFNRRPVPKEALAQEIELGIHALEIVNGEKQAYFKESVPISKNYDLSETLERLCVKAKLPVDCVQDPNTQISKFDAITFKGKRDLEVMDLYRYNIWLDPEEINNALIRERLSLVPGWFLHNINPETQIVEYEFWPSQGEYSPSNNYVRQLATLWGMTTLHKFLDETSLNALIDTSIDYFLGQAQCQDEQCQLEIEGKTNLGYNAFIILTLLKKPDYPESQSWQHRFAQKILANQREDGSYSTALDHDSDQGIKYYPGEAMLALMRLFQETNHREYLDSVKRAWPYYRAFWDQERNTAMIPWHTQALFLLYQQTKDPEIAAYLFEMNDWLIDHYQIQQSFYPDKEGAFSHEDPTACKTAVYLEGINDAYRLAQEVKDQERLKKYGQSIKKGTHFLLLTQYTPENSFYIAQQDQAQGGFRHSLTANEQRIDYQQHAINALIKTWQNNIFD